MVGQCSEEVKEPNASEASLADRKALQGMPGAIPEAGLVVVLRQEFQLARWVYLLQGSSFGGLVESFEALPSMVCSPK
jgi:hypothetical protein